MKKITLSPSNKAQATTIDFITGFVIILIALTIAANLVITIKDPNNYQNMQKTAYTATDALLSEGYPQAWNTTNYIKTGLLNKGQINTTKLAQIQTIPYQDLKSTLTNNNYNIYWHFKNKTTIQNITTCGYGDPSITTNPTTCEPTINAENNLLAIKRLVVHNNTILTMVIHVWD